MASTHCGPDTSSTVTADAPAPAAVPAGIDRYRLLRPLGRGGSGIVCEAEDTARDRLVAIKLIADEPEADAGSSERLREAGLAREVHHPNVVALYDTGTYGGGAYLVMELVEGPSVQSLLGDGALSWRDATAILIAACDGVIAVHAGGLVHCDVKPANLLRGVDGVVKLTDFGLARLPGPLTQVRSGTRPAGSPHYMSPEQCRDEALDERTDIYSLGATYYTLLTGWTPYIGTTAVQLMFQHCSAPVPDPRKENRMIPTSCAEIVMRAMAKRRADRFESARAMRSALRAALLGRSQAWPV